MPSPYLPYTFNQTTENLDLSFKVPQGSKSRDIEIKWEDKNIVAGVKNQAPTIKGEFYALIEAKNSIWQLEGDVVTLHIEKREDDIWPFVIKPGPEIDPCSQFLLGNAMEIGLALPKDRLGAFDLFRQAAESGMEQAQVKVGCIYAGFIEGFEIPRSESAAFRYFSYAANQHGNGDASLHVGRAYHLGLGVDQSPKMAETYYQKAAAQRNEAAIHNLGALYRTSPATADFKPDPNKALACFHAAAELGSADSCNRLGIIYFGSDPIIEIENRDLVKAKYYFEQAAKLSDGLFKVPEGLLEVLEHEAAEQKRKESEAKKKPKTVKRKTSGKAGSTSTGTESTATQTAKEGGRSNYMVGAVALGLITAFGLHWLATRK